MNTSVTPATAPATVTEEDLLKSLQSLEGRVAAVAAAPATVVVQTMEKTASATIRELGSDQLMQHLDVSDQLDEVVTLMGIHVDRSLDSLAKSLQGSADRDLSIVGALTVLAKAVSDNTAALATLGAQPLATAAERAVTVTSTSVLEKTVKPAPAAQTQQSPEQLRKSIADGLSTLVKNAGDESIAQYYTRSLLKFESANQISNTDMTAALAATKK